MSTHAVSEQTLKLYNGFIVNCQVDIVCYD